MDKVDWIKLAHNINGISILEKQLDIDANVPFHMVALNYFYNNPSLFDFGDE